MKSFLHFTLFGLIFFTIACTKQQVETTLSGQIINPVSTTVSISFNGNNLIDTLDANNKFSFSLSILNPENIRFKHGEEVTYLYLRPNDKLSLSLDPQSFDESLTYSGTNANINNYLAAIVLMEDSLISTQDLFSLEEKSFLLTLDSVADIKISAIGPFKIKDLAFLNSLKENKKWQVASNKMQFETYHKGYLELASFKVSDNFYTFQDELSINDSTQLIYSDYEGYIDAIISYESSQVFDQLEEQTAVTYYNTRYETVSKLISDPKIKQIFLFQLIRRAFTDFSDDTREQIVQEWRSLVPPSKAIEQYESIKTSWKVTQPGKQAPDFKYVSNTGDSLTLASFAGKPLYIDVWATWCGPCIAEHPTMEKLQARFKDQDITFLAVSIDGSPDPWIKMLEKKSLGGAHLYAPGAWESSIIQDYGINGIPRFILIDKEGEIIHADASRPSGNIAETIEKHLTPQRS